MTAPTPTSPFAARAVLVSLVVLLGLTPPEARGVALAGSSLLVLLLAAVGLPAAPRSGMRLAAAAVLLALPLVRVAQSPGAAIEPVAWACVAMGAALATAGLAGVPGVAKSGALALAGSAGVVSLHALYQELWGLERVLAEVAADPNLPDHAALVDRLAGGRAFAGFITPAALGCYLALAMPVTVALGLEARGRKRWGWLAWAALEAAAFVATASATAAGALLGATLLAALVGARARRASILALLLLGALVAAVAVQRGGIALRPDDPEGPWRLRAGNARAAWAMACDHPWLGVGPGGFAEGYPAYRQAGDNETRHVHNLPLELAAEHGFPLAVLLTVSFFVWFLGPLMRGNRGPGFRRGLGVGLAAFALHNLGDFTAFLPSLLWLAALMRGSLAEPPAPGRQAATVQERLALGFVGAALVAAVGVAGLAGLAAERRLDARFAAAVGEDQRVLELATEAQVLSPWQPDGALLLARAVERVRGTDAAEMPALAERAVALSPVRPAAHELRARVRLARGDLAGACVDFAQAARLYPRNEVHVRDAEACRAKLVGVWFPGKSEP